MPRAFLHQISAAAVFIVAVAAASDVILTFQYNSTINGSPNRIPVLVPGMTTRVRQTK